MPHVGFLHQGYCNRRHLNQEEHYASYFSHLHIMQLSDIVITDLVVYK